MTPTSLSMSRHLSPVSPVASVGDKAVIASSGRMRMLVERRLLHERPRHLRYLLSKLRSREDAEDTVQDFTIRALRGADHVREDRINAWLNISLRNALFDRYRRESSRRRFSEAAAVEPAPCAEPDGMENVSNACLSTSIAELKPSYSTVVRRADLEEASLGDLARELGLTSNNVAVRLHRARAVLRNVMHLRCTSCPSPCLLAARFIARSAA